MQESQVVAFYLPGRDPMPMSFSILGMCELCISMSSSGSNLTGRRRFTAPSSFPRRILFQRSVPPLDRTKETRAHKRKTQASRNRVRLLMGSGPTCQRVGSLRMPQPSCERLMHEHEPLPHVAFEAMLAGPPRSSELAELGSA